MGTPDRKPREHSYGRGTCAQRRAVLTGTLWTLAAIGLLVVLATVIGGGPSGRKPLEPLFFFGQP